MSLPLLQLSDGLIVCLCVFGWTAWSFLIGFVGNRLPLKFLEIDTWLTQQHSWYDDRQWYEQVLRIKSWKDRLPEAGNFFPGGFRKNSIGAGNDPVMYRFLAETRRAEYVHIAIWCFWLVSMFWTPVGGVLVNMFVGTAFNLPCLWVQRYNRFRLHHLLRLKTKKKTDLCNCN
jgi:glycosyl-4,4'-diaponeurosporenoate acyltransferase